MSNEYPYSYGLAKEICKAISTSSDGIAKLCKQHPDWPCKATIFEWLIEHDDFAAIYARAKKLQVEALMDELLDIADDSSQDIIETDKGFKYDHEHINRARLKVDTRKWIASKLVPHLYGDKIIEQKSNTDVVDQAREIAHKCKTE